MVYEKILFDQLWFVRWHERIDNVCNVQHLCQNKNYANRKRALEKEFPNLKKRYSMLNRSKFRAV